jgi:mannose-6-phosphate isomerase-like protein (cupin superfamily)
MLLIDTKKRPGITAADLTPIKELLSPFKDPVATHYSVAVARMPKGATNLPHRLKSSSELFIVTEGRGIMHIEDEAAEVSAGVLVYVPPGALQWTENIGETDLVFYCIVDPAWRADDESVVV